MGYRIKEDDNMYNPIKELRQLAVTTAVSVYDEDAVTGIELAGRTACKVNECVKLVNEVCKYLQTELEQTLKTALKAILTDYVENGELTKDLDVIVDEVLGGNY